MKTPEEANNAGYTIRDKRLKIQAPTGAEYAVIDAMKCPEWAPMPTRVAWRTLIKTIRSSKAAVSIIKEEDADVIFLLATQMALYRNHLEAYFDKEAKDAKWHCRELYKTSQSIESLLGQLLLTPASRKKINLQGEMDDGAISLLSEFGIKT